MFLVCSRTKRELIAGMAVVALLALAGCGDYRPGVDGRRPMLMQNLPANAQPQPAGSLPR